MFCLKLGFRLFVCFVVVAVIIVVSIKSLIPGSVISLKKSTFHLIAWLIQKVWNIWSQDVVSRIFVREARGQGSGTPPLHPPMVQWVRRLYYSLVLAAV